MRQVRLLIVTVLTAGTMSMVGCGSDASARFVAASHPAGTKTTAPVHPPAHSAVPSPAATTAITARATPTGSAGPGGPVARTGSTGHCGAGLAPAWASWPMPNPHGLGLPNQTSYTDLGSGGVQDNVTCLVWQEAYSPHELTWAAATSYCASLSIGGRGWRLPSRVELTSIVDFTRAAPAIDTGVFRGVANFFWTGSPWAVPHTPRYAWAVNFYEGLTTNAGDTDGAYFARCVKAGVGSGAATYQSVASGEVADTHTGLIWQRGGSAKPMSASAATAYCTGLPLGGHRWRLPSIKELATTVDESRVAPAINRSAFPDTARSSYYWSSSTSAPRPSATWALSYDDGFTSFYSVTSGYARCVR